MKAKLRSWRYDNGAIWVAVFTLLGLALRVWGVGFGLPQSYHPDELIYVPDAVRYISTLDFEPARWANPTLFKYLLALEYGIVYLITRVMGQAEVFSSFEMFFLNQPSIFYLLGRLSSGVLGAATIPVAYGVGTQAYGRKKGLVAAFLLTVCFLHVRDSHYAVSDVPMTFFFSAAVLSCFLYLRHRTSKYLYLAASLIGLAVATKYTASLLVVVFVAIWALANYSGNWRNLLRSLWNKEFVVAFVVMGLSFLIVCPYALLDYRDFLGALRSHYGMGKIGFAGYQLDPAGGWIFYLKTLVWGMGLPLTITTILAIGYALYKHRQADSILLMLVLLLYVFMGRQKVYFARFIIPILPFLAVLAGRFLWDIAVRLCGASRVAVRNVVIVFIILIVAQPTVSVVRHNTLLARMDTRTIAKQWIESHIPDGAQFCVEWHTPPLATASQPVPESNRTYRVSKSYIVGLAEHSLDEHRQNGCQYLLASSFIYHIPRIDALEDQSRRSFYKSLDVETELIEVFKPYDQGDEPPFIFDHLYGPATSLFQFDRPGPTIKVYKLQE